MRPSIVALLFALALPAAPARAQFAPPLGAKHAVGGPRTQMLTIGSTHLSGHSGEWSPQWLEPLNARLAAWKPTLITVEQLSGAQCEAMRANPMVHGEAYESYCRDAGPYQRSLRLSQPQAAAEVERRLAGWPASPTAADRRALAMLFMAAGDPYSAMVQWLRLPVAERHAGDTLNDEAVKYLSRPTGRMNETFDVAAEVAARVGLERLYAVDDHTSDATDYSSDPGFGPWQQARYDAILSGPVGRQFKSAEAAVVDAPTLLALYRSMNARNGTAGQIEADFGGAFADPHPRGFGRNYGAWWETRNLRMVSNIREATILHPGARVLNIVGSAHKAWYDQWLRQMADVDVADAAEVLGR